MRVRTQVAEFGGKQCEGERYGAEECNTHICHGNLIGSIITI